MGNRTSQKKNKKIVWIHGSSGRMGREIQSAILERKELFRLEGGSSRVFEGELFHQGKPVTAKLLAHSLSRVDLIFDFSTPEANGLLLEAAASGEFNKKAILIGTTGLSEKQQKQWESVGRKGSFRILIAPNTSIGILTMLKSAMQAIGLCSAAGFDLEIVETHHRNKLDAPSGTAKFLANSLRDQLEQKKPKSTKIIMGRDGLRKVGEIGMHAVRGGGVYGEHQIRFLGDAEELTISHRAFSRALFARGALMLGSWLLEQTPGFYSLSDVSFE